MSTGGVTGDPARAFLAPGKLMLAGEYSALGEEGIALCVAVAPGLRLEARPAPRWELARADQQVSWIEGALVPEALRFLQAAWQATLEALAAEGIAPPPQRLSTWSATPEAGGKVGLGGSASACALATAALHAIGGGDLERDRDTILARAIAAHRRAQSGRGSGYDVATVVLGGLVVWRKATARRASWPAGLGLVAGYSGRSASTRRMLERVFAIPEPEREAELRGLGVPVTALAAALESGDLPGLGEAIRECHRELAAWDRARELGIVTPELERLIALAGELGVAAKVSGAGAGDSAIALDPDLDRLDAVARAWRREGFAPLAISRDELGVREVRSS